MCAVPLLRRLPTFSLRKRVIYNAVGFCCWQMLSRLLNDFHLSTLRPPTSLGIKRYTPRTFDSNRFPPRSFFFFFYMIPSSVPCTYRLTQLGRMLHVVTVYLRDFMVQVDVWWVFFFLFFSNLPRWLKMVILRRLVQLIEIQLCHLVDVLFVVVSQ